MSLLGDEATAQRGYEVAYALLRSPVAENPNLLNALSWNILTSDKVAVRDHAAAITLAAVAAEKTSWEDPSIIDTLARGYFDSGKIAKAIELQEKAVELAKGTRMEEDLTDSLNKYRAAKD